MTEKFLLGKPRVAANEFCLDAEGFPYAEELCRALGGLAESDAPLLAELVLVSEEEIRALNRDRRGVDGVTDVLSFPSAEWLRGAPVSADAHADCLDEEGRLLIGSVAVCEKRAKEQAAEYGHSYEREVCYLAVHGILHCLGYDHTTEEERREMREKEEEVMRRMHLTRE